jgi:iron complex transport system substrate-binding protein
MKIASFLPSATEILFALGAGAEVCGVTFECDYPTEAAAVPVVVHSWMQAGLSPRAIDDLVRATAHAGGSLYVVDWQRLQVLAPDLVIAQDLCRVCAIDTPTLARELSELPHPPQVLSLEPHGLYDVLYDIERVGEAIGRKDTAHALTAALRARLDDVRHASARDTGRKPRVLCLEWLDPLYQGGHWVPEMVEIVGGDAVLTTPGAKSVRLSWEQVLEADPEIVVLMPCGYHLRETLEQFRAMSLPAGWVALTAVRTGRVYAVDGTAYFSRPGPRLVEGVEILRAILCDDGRGAAFTALPTESVARVDPGPPL